MTFPHIHYLFERKEQMRWLYVRLPFVVIRRGFVTIDLPTELQLGKSAHYDRVFRASVVILGFGAGLAWRKDQ